MIKSRLLSEFIWLERFHNRVYCLFLRLEISTSIQPRFEDTKGWPSLFSSEESSDLFYWAKLPFNQSNRRRHREVWIERKSKHSTLSCDYFNCHNCSPSAVHLWNRQNILLSTTFQSYFQNYSFSLRCDAARWNPSIAETHRARILLLRRESFDCRSWFFENHRPSDDNSLIEISRGPARWYLLEMYESDCRGTTRIITIKPRNTREPTYVTGEYRSVFMSSR